MGRKFKDRTGQPWDIEVSPQSRREWVFHRVGGTDREDRIAPAPSHVDDPFEVSDGELQELLDRSRHRFPPRKEPPPGLR